MSHMIIIRFLTGVGSNGMELRDLVRHGRRQGALLYRRQANKYRIRNCKPFVQEGTGSLFYFTSIVCHFRPLLLCALRRSVEWAKLRGLEL